MVIHAHCHAKALTNPAYMRRLAERLPRRNVTLLDTGCCGMAGAFGVLAIQIRAVAQGRRAAGPEGPGTALRHRRGRLRHQLPPSDRAPGARPRAAHGRGAGRRAGTSLTPALCTNLARRTREDLRVRLRLCAGPMPDPTWYRLQVNRDERSAGDAQAHPPRIAKNRRMPHNHLQLKHLYMSSCALHPCFLA